MALQTSGIVLPRSVATVVTGKAKDASTIAVLSPAKPEIFEDETYLIFNGASEAEVIAEGAAKSSYEQPVSPIVGTRFTVQTTTRVSNQLKWADEDNQLQIIESIQDDQGAALGRALDYVVYHAISPKSGLTLGAGFTPLSTSAVQVYTGKTAANMTDADWIAAFDDLADATNDLYDINGIAMAKPYASALRKIRVPSSMARMYPDIPLNLNVGALEGVPAAVSGTVNGRLVVRTPASGSTPAVYGTDVLAFMGDFSMIRWGMVRDIRAEVIEYGDPDGAGDLKRYNQIAYRTEAVYAYAIVNPAALAVLKLGVQGA
jgi:hypothetical protein